VNRPDIGPDVRRLADESGRILGFAFDHRDSLEVELAELGLHLGHDQIADLKEAIVRAVAPAASAVMLDDEFGRSAIERGALPDGVALIMPLEAQGYAQAGDDRVTDFLPEFSPATARDRGAVACKLLLPLRADRPALFDRQLGAAATAIAMTHQVGLLAVLEPQVYRRSDESREAYTASYRTLTLRASAALAALGPDLLKLPFPILDARLEPDRGSRGSADAVGDVDGDAAAACRALTEAVNPTPWVLYGGGVSTTTFAWQLRHALDAGALGFLVGRTIWRDALSAEPARSAAIAERDCLPRFRALVRVAREERAVGPTPSA
jgi:tagatose 1,6-diphosphate aldolase